MTEDQEPGRRRGLTGRLGTRRGGVIFLSNATYVSTALGLVTSPILARILGPTGRGEVAGAMAYAFFVSAVLALGFPLAVAHFAAPERTSIGDLMGTIVLYSVICVPLSVAASILIIRGPLADFSEGGRLAARILILTAPVYVLQLSVQSILIAQGRLISLSKLQYIGALEITAGVGLLAATARLRTISYAILYVAILVIGAALAWKYVGARPRFRTGFMPLLVFSLKAAPAGLANFASLRLDQIVVAPLLGAHSLGIYAIAVSIAAVPNALGNAIALASYNAVAAAFVRGEEEALDEAARSVRLCIIGTGALATAVGVATPIAVPLLFGHSFQASVVPLLVLLPGSVAIAVASVSHSTLIALGRPLAASAGELIGLVATALGLALFIRRYGVTGAAMVSTVAYIMSMIVFLGLLYQMGARHLLPGRTDVSEQVNWARSRARSLLPQH